MIWLDVDRKQIMRALVGFCVEKVLLDISKPTFENVANRLYKEYRCYIPDCYDNPEYLNSVLKSIFGNSYVAIVQAIKSELSEHLEDEAILRLVQIVGN